MSRHPLTGYPAFRPLEEIERLKFELAISQEANRVKLEEIERLRTERDTAIAHLDDRDRDVERLRSRLTKIAEIAENYEDGAPDAPGWVRAFMTIAGICDGEVVP